ncbi:MAG: hypothetical protein IT427_00075 [Pirellulales bacterium]|nr:hypothetical protein [Pirellulales bacterium]
MNHLQQMSNSIWAYALMLLPALAIGIGLRRARGTTLVAPLAWALLAYTLINVVNWGIAPVMDRGTDTEAEKWIYIASIAALCPTVALFGAKRPQNRAWQWIVLAFWIVLSLPAIQSLLMSPGEPLALHEIWQWLLAIFILAGCLNYLPTRFGGPCLLVALGQVALFWNFLPWTSQLPSSNPLALGSWIFIAAIGAAFWKGRQTARVLSQYHGWNRAWLDFRDSYGVVWSMRIMERVNSLPAVRISEVRLRWSGCYETPPETSHVHGDATRNPNESSGETAQPNSPLVQNLASPDVLVPLGAALRNLLLRFVSKQWLDVRLESHKRHAK